MTTPRRKKRTPKARQQRTAARRKKSHAQGLRPAQFRVPDVRDPKLHADLRRQARLMAQHPENDDIDAWIESMTDLSEWR